MLVKLLWVTGVLAAVALLVRGAVVAGMYLFVVPGLVLMIAPTVFAYLLAVAAIRMLLPLPGGFASTIAAGAIALLIGVGLAWPMNLKGRAEFAAAASGEVIPAAPIRLAGHIRLVRERTVQGSASEPREAKCEAQCAALLETPGVLSVTVEGFGENRTPIRPTTFRLVPRGTATRETVVPEKPEAIIGDLPRPRTTGRGLDAALAEREALDRTIKARWALRLAREQALVREPARDGFDQRIVMREVNRGGIGRVTIAEVEVTDAGGRVLGRRQRVTASVVAIPLHLIPEGPMLDRGWGWGRTLLHTGERWGELKHGEALFELTTLAQPRIDEASVAAVRERLAAAIAGQGPRGDLEMVPFWLRTLEWSKLGEAEVALIGALLADTSVSGLDKLYDGYARHVDPRLRRPIAIRLLDSRTEGSFRYRLNELVRNMPEGTYATLLPEEAALLRDPVLRLDSSVYAARLADGGAAAVPVLTALLRQTVVVQPWARRQWIMADLGRAFSQLGPLAAPALPLVEQLSGRPDNPLANDWRGARNWRIAMVRMGKPVEALSFPDQLKPETVARDREDIARMAARPFDPMGQW